MATLRTDVAFTAPDRWLQDGDTIDAGGIGITARATPGHTRGHMVFETAGLAFTGDHLLPRITPSIAMERAPEKLPLRSYLRSLQLFLDLPDVRMLPAHGGVDQYTRGRAQELLDHHDERLAAVTELIAAGAATAFDVARRMRWTRHERHLTELDTIHQMVAVLEVLAPRTAGHPGHRRRRRLRPDQHLHGALSACTSLNFWTFPVGVAGSASAS